ncbi:hypothetical protein BDM02DRAFT_3119877 [Thelephora ganbajun]|uniref:Uncharacterized protein n=1 Tax=Thelephora ganbajun TaxID=370292 RepID=A0ACB6Z8F8_THEGA|nr:hypothetical protein BDM02DRAFT_3119877 [Thelephora ganbajun]
MSTITLSTTCRPQPRSLHLQYFVVCSNKQRFPQAQPIPSSKFPSIIMTRRGSNIYDFTGDFHVSFSCFVF